MQFKHIAYLLFLLLLTCSQENEIQVQTIDFQNKYSADELERVEIPPVLLKERQMIFTQDYLVSVGADKDTSIRVFDRQTMNYLGGFGERGDGPKQFNPMPSSLYPLEGNRIHIGTYKDNRIFEIQESSDENNPLVIKEISKVRVPGSLAFWHSSVALNDSIYAGIQQFSNNPLMFFNTIDKKTSNPYEFPNFYKDIDSDINHILYQGSMRFSLDLKKAIFTYRLHPLISIIDLENDQKKHIRFNTKYKQQAIRQIDERNINSAELNLYYRLLQVSNNYIYALYRPISSSNMGRKNLGDRELHVFDLNGKPAFKLKLQWWMDVFVVDPEDQFIYFWHPEIEDVLFKKDISGYS